MFDTDGEGGAPVAYNNASDCSSLVHALDDSGASDYYFDDFVIPYLNRRRLDYTCLTKPRNILTAGGALLDRTGEGFL